MISSAILGIDCETVTVAGRVHVLRPPTIERLCGAMLRLSPLDTEGRDTLAEVINGLRNMDGAARALSWFIAGDESLAGEFRKGTVDEVTGGLLKALGMVSAQNFTALSASVRNVRRLAARPKP